MVVRLLHQDFVAGRVRDLGNCPGHDAVACDGPQDGMRFAGNVGLGQYAVLILSQDD